MPNSYTFYKNEVKEYFKYHVHRNTKILDVGPGQGTYAKLLNEIGYKMDAIEAWPPYVDQFNLTNLYRHVYIGDIRDFDYSSYGYIILGDILEHLTVEEGQKLIQDITNKGIRCLVAIPYMMEQDGEEYGNSYETHLQADLSHEMMKIRYPELIELYSNNLYGYYTNYKVKHNKAYVLYANESYIPVVKACVASIKEFSSLPVYVYILNGYEPISGANVITWNCPIPEIPINNYIDRSNKHVYRLLIERPAIVKDALLHHAHSVAYIDSDSVATPYIDTIFDMYPKMNYPYFVEGIYDYLHINGRGGADTREDMSTTLEAPACELFGVNQYIRQKYRQTGYFVANHYCFDFLDEWYWMCKHPKILANHEWYAPYHEETIANVLLWKWNIHDGLPYIYTNTSIERLKKIYNNKYKWGEHNGNWFRLPANESELLFLHGEKNTIFMQEMLDFLKKPKRMKIVYLAPHLSTGGMPQFLLKRIESLLKYNYEIHCIEHSFHGDAYTVQRNQIKELLKERFHCHFKTKIEIFDLLNILQPDIIHLDDVSEKFDSYLIKKIYNSNRQWRIVETPHDVIFNPDNDKVYIPDLYLFCTPYHTKTYSNVGSQYAVIEYPIDDTRSANYIDARMLLGFDLGKKHVINVGLWTPGKNQGEMIEIAKKYPDIMFHSIGNRASNFEHYWGKYTELPENVKLWGERADISTFMAAADIFMFNSINECSPLVLREAIGYELPIVARNLPEYDGMFDDYLNPIDSDLRNLKTNYTTPKDKSTEQFARLHNISYTKILKIPIKQQPIRITQHFRDNPFLEIKGQSDSKFTVKFYDENGICHYDNIIKSNCWVKLNRKYFTKWTARIWQDDELIYNESLNLNGKMVFISFESKSLGDTIAWMPYVHEFKKKHNCDVIVSTHWNHLFDYSDIEFVTPGTAVGCYAMYRLGWFWDTNKEPELCNTIPLQKAASNILGLEFKEIKPKLKFEPYHKWGKKNVVIATNSTMECKFWTREGWQEVINYLWQKGYEVINVSKEDNPFENCTKITDTSIGYTMQTIQNAELFIGLSSGLSWLAWALNKKVVMISNFTEKGHEFDCYRVINTSVCNSCWNDPNIKLDPFWNWCPRNKNFECQRKITANLVIDKIKEAGF